MDSSGFKRVRIRPATSTESRMGADGKAGLLRVAATWTQPL